MNLELAGKACLVAGASRGIGREIAIALAREGASVIGAARGADDLAQLAADLGEAGGGPHATVVADVSTATGADAAIAAAITSFGRLDIVVANVGKSFARDALQMDDDDLAKSLDTNLWSAARVAQRARPHLESTRGSITMIASIWGRESGGAPGYNVAKAGVVALAKALAHDYARFGIRVNSVAPGSILFPGGGWERRMKADPRRDRRDGRARAAVRKVRHFAGRGRECRRVRRVAARELDHRRVHRRRWRTIARLLGIQRTAPRLRRRMANRRVVVVGVLIAAVVGGVWWYRHRGIDRRRTRRPRRARARARPSRAPAYRRSPRARTPRRHRHRCARRARGRGGPARRARGRCRGGQDGCRRPRAERGRPGKVADRRLGGRSRASRRPRPRASRRRDRADRAAT